MGISAKVTGMWENTTKFGTVHRAKKVKRSDILKALEEVPGDLIEIELMPAKERKGDTSPSHYLRFKEPWVPDDRTPAAPKATDEPDWMKPGYGGDQ